MLKDMKPIRGIQVGDLVRYNAPSDEYTPPIWAGQIGIVFDLPKTHITDISSYPSIFWSNGEIGTAHRQFLEIISETKGERND